MINSRNINKDKELLFKYGKFSKNMTQHHHLENLSEFVLHDLCYTDFFALPKAAFFVNNPDFACLKGVAGYHHPEAFPGAHWVNHKDFTAHMQNSDFNKKVRLMQDSSLVLGNNREKDKVFAIADQLEIIDPMFHIWNMRHNNQGLFIFEKSVEAFELQQNHLLDFLYMLSFCPVF